MSQPTLTTSNDDPAASPPADPNGQQVMLVRKHELALLARAARLLAAIWNEDEALDDLVDAAIAAGLTIERDVDDGEVETEVSLSPDFYAALEDAEATCGILPADDHGD